MLDSIDLPKAKAPSLAHRLAETRRLSLELAAPLTAEDQTVQAMDDASPTKWHLAHTTWFFETMVLRPFLPGYRPFDERYAYCFNSYYEALGARHPRPQRGLLTRPSAADVIAYRHHVDEALERLLGSDRPDGVASLVELGINHEQQHQELILTDILSLFALNPLKPAYRQARPRQERVSSPLRWLPYDGGIVQVGHDGRGFCFDNERPRHDALLAPFRLADRLVTNSEWIAFIEAGGYSQPTLWLADGWATVQREAWVAPGYWEEIDGGWQQMTLAGLQPIEADAPVAHVSYYEADAFARWAGKRLPSEAEWEVAGHSAREGNTLASRALTPLPATRAEEGEPRQMLGDVWEWTQSAYAPYPGYRAPEGAVGEYNGKFMCSQQVLRGASCVTPVGHSRATYRNFFYPHQRWQFTGVRLAEDAS
jgi:ergothioneine biosynthesis protein EgtB